MIAQVSSFCGIPLTCFGSVDVSRNPSIISRSSRRTTPRAMTPQSAPHRRESSSSGEEIEEDLCQTNNSNSKLRRWRETLDFLSWITCWLSSHYVHYNITKNVWTNCWSTSNWFFCAMDLFMLHFTHWIKGYHAVQIIDLPCSTLCIDTFTWWTNFPMEVLYFTFV